LQSEGPAEREEVPPGRRPPHRRESRGSAVIASGSAETSARKSCPKTIATTIGLNMVPRRIKEPYTLFGRRFAPISTLPTERRTMTLARIAIAERALLHVRRRRRASTAAQETKVTYKLPWWSRGRRR